MTLVPERFTNWRAARGLRADQTIGGSKPETGVRMSGTTLSVACSMDPPPIIGITPLRTHSRECTAGFVLEGARLRRFTRLSCAAHTSCPPAIQRAHISANGRGAVKKNRARARALPRNNRDRACAGRSPGPDRFPTDQRLSGLSLKLAGSMTLLARRMSALAAPPFIARPRQGAADRCLARRRAIVAAEMIRRRDEAGASFVPALVAMLVA